MSAEILVGAVAEDRPRGRAVQALVRDGLSSVIEAPSIDHLVAACAGRHPHVVVHVGGRDAAHALRRLARELPRTRLVAVIAGAERSVVRWALLAGAHGVVAVADVPTTLPVTVRAVWAGQTVVPTAVRAVLETAELSHREREVLDLVAAGLTNAQIADRLCLTEHTVKSHVSSVFTKLRVHSRSEAIAAHAQRHAEFASSPQRLERTLNGDTTHETTVHRRQ